MHRRPVHKVIYASILANQYGVFLCLEDVLDSMITLKLVTVISLPLCLLVIGWSHILEDETFIASKNEHIKLLLFIDPLRRHRDTMIAAID